MDVLLIGQIAALALLSPYLYGAWLLMAMYVEDVESGAIANDERDI